MTLAELGFRLESKMPEWMTSIRCLTFIVVAMLLFVQGL